MLTTARLQTSPPVDSLAITFPPVTAQKWTLPNGLTIIVQTDRSAPVASVQAWCGTGSINEGRHLGAGLSHILEHMLFKGTTTRSTNEIARSVQDEGGYINAYTSFDRTVYWIDVPREGVWQALDILADAMMNSTLPAEEYGKEQEVIRREFAMCSDDPDRMMGQLMFKTAYQRHPYRFPVIGEIQIFDQLTQEEVVEYYRARYVPNNLTFVVAGDVDAAAVYAQLEKYFSAYPARSLAPGYIAQEPPQQGRREVNEEFATELTRGAARRARPCNTQPPEPPNHQR
jgi:zinc protease